MLRALIGTPSVSSTKPEIDQSNLALIHLLADWLETLDFHVQVLPLPEQPDKANLIATLGPTEPGAQGLVLSGHTDTVPFDAGQWQHDPFKLTERDQRYYGLGSSDMKSFFAFALDVAAQYRTSELKRPLIILATADEESAMSGARALLKQHLAHARYAIIGEPTCLRPVHMHKGVMMESLVVHGHAGHSSNPALGASAVEGMHWIMRDLLKWRAELQQQHRNARFEVDVPTMNFGSIHGGDNPNRICAHCEMQIDIRPLPGMQLDQLREELERRLKPLFGESTGLRLEHRPIFCGVPPFATDAHARLVQTAERHTGHAAQAVAFGTEAPYLTELGLETIILGPGNIDQAHQPDEYLDLSRIDPYCKVLHQLVRDFCL